MLSVSSLCVGHRRGGGGGNLSGRLLTEKSAAEREAARHLHACNEELRKSRTNEELLYHDWRLGGVRLLSWANPKPPGFADVNPDRCNLELYLRALERGGGGGGGGAGGYSHDG